jgi:NAD(P)-dependent dehydrogenase (short-subunit alcohol dehydrogenase family)
MNVVITGGSRGIGLELATQALNRGDRVFVFARKPEESAELQVLKAKFGSQFQLEVATLDLSLPGIADTISTALAPWPVVDVLINNAGIYRNGETPEDFLSSFQVNSVAPLFVTRALFQKLKKSQKPIVAHITSLMGSIDDNQSGGAYAYRASKTALNMISKTLAQDERWLISTVIHPGWVQTRMGGKDAPTPVAESASGLWKVIQKLKSEDTGSFFDHEGDRLPW